MTEGTAGRKPRRGTIKSIQGRRRRTAYGLLTPGGLYLFAILILPLVIMIFTSLKTGGLLSGGFHFDWPGDWSNYTQAITDYPSQFARSVIYAGIATLSAIILAYPMMYWIAFKGGKWKASLLLLILLPFFVSYVVRTVQWKWILADNGMLLGTLKHMGLIPDSFRILATPFAVIAGLTYDFVPFVALPLFVALDRINPALIEAAGDLFASPWTAFRKVVFPLSLPGVFAALILSFVPMAGDYVNPEILGGPSTQMIGNVIQYKFLTAADYPMGSALSVILMIGMVILASIYAKILGTEEATNMAAA
jgi:spermidine/putrescine transport system permease protein